MKVHVEIGVGFFVYNNENNWSKILKFNPAKMKQVLYYGTEEVLITLVDILLTSFFVILAYYNVVFTILIVSQ